MDDATKFSHLARRCALSARGADGRVRAYAALFDDVQAFALELDCAGDFEDAHVRFAADGPWDWRHFVREAAQRDVPGRPASFAPLGAFASPP